MKLTTSQLQEIIRREVKAIQERRVYDEQGNIVHPGGLPPSGKMGKKKHVFLGNASDVAEKYISMLEDIMQQLDAEQLAKTPMFGPVMDVIREIKSGVENLISEIDTTAQEAEATMASDPYASRLKK
jgi:hypothetical protein